MRVHPTAYIHPDATVHPSSKIGPNAVIDGPVRIGVSMISQDVPPFTMTDHQGEIIGLNVIGLALKGISPAEQQELKDLFKVICRSGITQRRSLELAAELANTELGRQFVDFFQAETRRGFCRFRGKNSRLKQSILTPLKQQSICK